MADPIESMNLHANVASRRLFRSTWRFLGEAPNLTGIDKCMRMHARGLSTTATLCAAAAQRGEVSGPLCFSLFSSSTSELVGHTMFGCFKCI